jgi:osmoprotectant transport system permease protein
MPTVFALFIYGLLPIVQSTTSGLLALDPKLIETAQILGLSPLQRLRLIELPLASISILGGIKTTAVINVATATIAALIGAGGYGDYITSGLAMNDIPTILQGAIPTALMAVGFHALFEILNRLVVPRGLRCS